VSSGIIVGAISLAIAASLAVCKKGLVRRDIFTDPNFAYNRMYTFKMSSKFMFTMEAIGLIVAELAEGLGSRGSLDRGFWNSSDLT
jgi:hypothetical protein